MIRLLPRRWNAVQIALLIGMLALLTTRALPASVPLPGGSAGTEPGPAAHARMVEGYGRLPLTFEANDGQHDAAVDFLARGSGYTLWLTPTEAVFALRAAVDATDGEPRPPTQYVVRMQLLGGDPAAAAGGEEPLPGMVNYFTGDDPARWRTGVTTFGKVRYTGVYPGIDLLYYGNQQRLEYDFSVAPGADPSVIALAFAGVEGLRLAEDGDLLLSLAGRELRWEAPVLYQSVEGRRVPVASAYRLIPSAPEADAGATAIPTVGFRVGDYDPSLPLVIDPVLAYSTFLGGTENDFGMAIAVDAATNAYVTGYTDSANFPTMNPYQPAFGGSQDLFVTKLDPTGATLVYSTYLGGSAFEVGRGIALDAAGNVYLTGNTSSANFPITAGAYDQVHNGSIDTFVTKLNAAGNALVYSTYLGGAGNEEGHGIALDASNRAYVTGWTDSSTFPTTAGAYDTIYNNGTDAFVTRLNAAGTSLSYSTFLGGTGMDKGYGIAVAANEAYVTGSTTSSFFPTTAGAWDTALSGGSDAFVTRLGTTGAALLASTFVGGTVAESGEAIALGGGGHLFVTGWTSSADYSVTVGAYDTIYGGGVDAFVTKLNGALTSLTYSTYLGADGYDAGSGIAVNSLGGALVTGQTGSANFPTVNPVQAAFAGGVHDAFVVRVVPTGTSLNFSTFHGGAGYDLGTAIALDTAGLPYVTGVASDGFPTTAGAYDTTHNGGGWDAFISKFGP